MAVPLVRFVFIANVIILGITPHNIVPHFNVNSPLNLALNS